MKRKQHNTGFTMIEATIAMVILAVAAAGILLPFGAAAATQDEALKQFMAANLGTELMEKVLFTEPNDIITTWDGHVEGQGAMCDAAKVVYSDLIYNKFSRSVQCIPAVTASVNMVVVNVYVYYDGREMTRLMTMVKE